MSDKPENPPAFPAAYAGHLAGMTLRDWFAGQALSAMPKLGDTDAGIPGIAHDAYMLADAMLAERAR